MYKVTVNRKWVIKGKKRDHIYLRAFDPCEDIVNSVYAHYLAHVIINAISICYNF